MKFNTRSKVAAAALIAGSALVTGALGSGGSVSASTCVLNNYTFNGSAQAPFVVGTIPAPAPGADLQTIYITYAATGEGEQIQVAIGGIVVGGTGGAGGNVILLNGVATATNGGAIQVQHASGTAGGLTITNVFVQTNTCTEDVEITTTTAAPTTTAAATTTTAAATTTTAAATTTTQVASGAPTTTTTAKPAATTTTQLASAGPTTTTTPASLPAGVPSVLPATGGNTDAIGFLAGLALFIGTALLVVRRRTTAQ